MSATPEDGTDLIADERARQLVHEGYGLDHDLQHTDEQLIRAAQAYLDVAWTSAIRDDAAYFHRHGHAAWPWRDQKAAPIGWKPSDDPIRNLARAGALIAAEIDRRHGRANDAEPFGWPRDAGLESTLRERIADAVGDIDLDDTNREQQIADAVMAELGLNGVGWVLIRTPTDRHHFAPAPEVADG